MRPFLRFLPFLLILPAGAVPVWLHDHAETGAQLQMPAPPSLEVLFERLRNSENAQAAARQESEIYLRLTKSNSASVDLLLERASVAYAQGDQDGARGILDDVAALAPDFAEGLTRAAALAYDDGDRERTRALLKRALAAEPRHFGAWAGLGLLLEDAGDWRGAQHAYREALYWHPFFDAAKRGLLRVEAKTDGLRM